MVLTSGMWTSQDFVHICWWGDYLISLDYRQSNKEINTIVERIAPHRRFSFTLVLYFLRILVIHASECICTPWLYRLSRGGARHSQTWSRLMVTVLFNGSYASIGYISPPERAGPWVSWIFAEILRRWSLDWYRLWGLGQQAINSYSFPFAVWV